MLFMLSCMKDDLILYTFLTRSRLESIKDLTSNLRVTDLWWIRYVVLESRKGEMSKLVMFIAFWNASGGWSRTYRCLRVSVWSKLSTLISFCACDCLWFDHVCPWDCSDTSPETCWSVVTRYSHTSSCFSCSGVCKMILFW